MHFTRYFLSSATIVALLLLTGVFGCRYTTGQVIVSTPRITDSLDRLSVLRAFTMPVDSTDQSYRGLASKPVRAFYAGRQDRLFWTSPFKRSGAADSLVAFIQKIRYYGLLPRDYHLAEVEMLKNKLNSAENVYRFEALLTDAYITLARHFRFGKAARATGQSDSLGLVSLESVSRNGGLVRHLTAEEPSLQGYRSLKQGLRQFLDSLPQDQRDAVLSSTTLVEERIDNTLRSVGINLERWRSERLPFGSRYIFINIPAFMLYVIENDSVVLESRIIVGAPETPTPELSSVIECFITYPYWHVPRKIAIGEYLPLIQADTAFLARNNFDVLDRRGKVLRPDSLDWKKFNKNYFPVSLRQREGEENALGVLKFVFENPYAVFLHDTNARRLFRSSVRAFSHGCIRMEKAVELSHYLVTGDLRKSSKYVERFLQEESRHTVELQRPIPVHVRYYTCDFNNGTLNRYADIYNKDALIGDILYGDSGARDF